MIEKKIQLKFVDQGFGFPVHLLNVPMIKVRGRWTPNINYAELSAVVLKALAVNPVRLTGNELKFIRQSLGMTLKDFAHTFYVTHPAVMKWEGQKSEPTKMAWATEKDIRLFVISQAGADDLLPTVYKQLRTKAPETKRNTRIDLQENVPVCA